MNSGYGQTNSHSTDYGQTNSHSTVNSPSGNGTGSYYGSSSNSPTSGNVIHPYGQCPVGPLAPGGKASTR